MAERNNSSEIKQGNYAMDALFAHIVGKYMVWVSGMHILFGHNMLFPIK
jgi:hypothetical protein